MTLRTRISITELNQAMKTRQRSVCPTVAVGECRIKDKEIAARAEGQ